MSSLDVEVLWLLGSVHFVCVDGELYCNAKITGREDSTRYGAGEGKVKVEHGKPKYIEKM